LDDETAEGEIAGGRWADPLLPRRSVIVEHHWTWLAEVAPS
jgi:hypothetical protein